MSLESSTSVRVTEASVAEPAAPAPPRAQTPVVMEAAVPAPPAARMSRTWRIVAVVAVLGLAAGLSYFLGLTSFLSTENTRALVEAAGAWGALLFLALFAVRDFVQVPAFLFVSAAVLAYGPWHGAMLGFVGVMLAVNVCFVVTRLIGGRAQESRLRMRDILDNLEARGRFPRILRFLRRLDGRPVLTVVVLRHMAFSHSGLNCTLALSAIRFRDYVIGSALGLAIPTAVTAYLAHLAVVAATP